MSEPDRRGWFWGCDPDEPADRIVMDIASGVAKADSEAITSPHLSDLWDRMEPGISAAMARGQIIDCDNGAGGDD